MHNYANYKLRLVASLLDICIGLLVVSLLLYFVASRQNLPDAVSACILLIIVLLNPLYIYLSVLLTYYFGGSLGKLLIGLRVIAENGGKLSFKRVFFRQTIGYMFSGIFFGFGFYSIIKNEKKQAWHDQAVGSYVIQKGNLLLIGLVLLIITMIASVSIFIKSFITFADGPLVQELQTIFEQKESDINTVSKNMSDWRIYSNDKLYYSFKYPDKYFKYLQEIPDLGVYLAPSKGIGGNGPKFLKENDVWLNVAITSSANLQSVDEFLSIPGQQIYPADAKKTKTIIGSERGYILEYPSSASADGTLYNKTGIFLNNGNIYAITLTAWNKEALFAFNGTFTNILNSFHTLGADNKLIQYTNTTEGFILSYDPLWTVNKGEDQVIVEFMDETGKSKLRILKAKNIDSSLNELKQDIGHTGYVLLGIKPTTVVGSKDARVVELGYSVGVPAAYYVYLAKNDSESIIIQWYDTSRKTLDQILSSFTFLD